MAQKSKDIIVIGGSLGGLFTGIVLKRNGHNVRIFERNPTSLLQNQGAGVVAGPETVEFFGKYDLTHTPVTIQNDVRRYIDINGDELYHEDFVQTMTSWDLLYYVMRANFDNLDSDYCKAAPTPMGTASQQGSATYKYGHNVTRVCERSDKRMEVQYSLSKDGDDTQTTTADLVVAADGADSTVRSLLEPDRTRNYAGYMAWRGTLPESEASAATHAALAGRFTFFHGTGMQFICYLIPGTAGTMEAGKRLLNWVWYYNCPEDSAEFEAIMTDDEGVRRKTSMPVGKMAKSTWLRQQQQAQRVLPPAFCELVQRTKHPFIQLITDVISPRNAYYDGKLLLLGDAAAGFRPHTVASTNQAAFYAMQLGEMLNGQVSQDEWRARTIKYSRQVQAHGVTLGERSQFGMHKRPDDRHTLVSMARVSE